MANKHHYFTYPFLIIGAIILSIAPLTVHSKEQNNDLTEQYCSEEFRHFLIHLAKKSHQTSYTDINGWFDLIHLNESPSCQQNIHHALQQWKLNYPQHPAYYFFPKLLSQQKHERLTNIALLLPFEQRYDDFSEELKLRIKEFAKKYHFKITTYDTSRLSIAEIKEQLINNNEQCVLGPLLQENIQQLNQLNLSLPSLALSTLKNEKIKNLFLFQLSISDSSLVTNLYQQLQDKLLLRGLLFYTDSKAHQKISQDLLNKKQGYFGKWLDKALIPAGSSDYSQLIKTSLLLQQSHQRYLQLKYYLRDELFFEPRRRQDIDFISLIAPNHILNSLYPQLRYWHADNLAIFALISESSLSTNSDDLRGLKQIFPAWYQQNKSNSFMDEKINFLGKTATELIWQTNCMELDRFIIGNNKNWQLEVTTSTFLLDNN